MKKIQKTEEQLTLDPIVANIWENVVYSMDQYTHDSPVSKFYLPEDIMVHCREVSAIFAQVHYVPILTTEEVYKSRLYSLFFLSMLCGVQIYLKERSLEKNYSPYTLLADEKMIRAAKNKVTRMLFDGAVILETVDQVMNLFLAQLMLIRQRRRFTIKNKDFDEEKFDRFLPASILWGYLFAKEMVLDQPEYTS
jgi:hypothetical protein